jgi:predicted SprT family Zn-dependent metalloprotease
MSAEKRLLEFRVIANNFLFKEGLISKGWIFDYDNAKRRAGCCHYDDEKITISKHLVLYNNSYDEIVNTILHEIAHALAPRESGHDYKWRKIFRDLLIKYDQPVNVTRCYDNNKVVMPKRKYIVGCNGCSAKWGYHKRTKLIKQLEQNCCHYFCRGCGKTNGKLKLV